MMSGGTTEVMDGYRILWLSKEGRGDASAALTSGQCDGLGFNPYKGWNGTIADYFAIGPSMRAVGMPFGDKVGLTTDFFETNQQLEMVLLSEYQGTVHFAGTKLRVLRVMSHPRMTFGVMPNLVTLYVRNIDERQMLGLAKNASSVTTLELNDGAISSLDGIDGLAGLETLSLWNMKKLRSIKELASCKRLKRLTIESTKKIADIGAVIGELPALQTVRLLDCGTLPNLDFVKNRDLDEFVCSRTNILSSERPVFPRIRRVVIK